MAFPYISLGEIFDVIIMSLAIGYIFKDMIPAMPRKQDYDPLIDRYEKPASNFKYGIMAAAPAIVLHEFSHKFVAITSGVNAVFHADYFWLLIGVGLKLLGSPFIFLVPGYVEHSANVPLFQSAMIAVAGPAMNLFLWVGLTLALRSKKLMKKVKAEYIPVLRIAKYINGFLFIINMIPISPFDGSTFFQWLVGAVGSIVS